jgi:uncharacterized protein with PQ loop repeat
VLTETLAILATCFTIGRTWPQFLRIVVRGNKQGVSLSTWVLALTNHVAWFMYGVLTVVPVFIICNFLAALGCAATVWVLHSWQRMAQVTVATMLLSLAVYAVGDPVMLTTIVCVTMAIVIPQLYAVLRSPASGVSTIAWLVSAMSSATWIAWAASIHRLTVVVAHFVLLPAALIIAARAIHAHRRESIVDLTTDAATSAP